MKKAIIQLFLDDRNSNYLVVGGLASGSIIFWDISTGENMLTLSGHPNAVMALKLISDQILASASRDMTIKLWNLTTGTNYLNLVGHSGAVMSLEYLSSGDLVYFIYFLF